MPVFSVVVCSAMTTKTQRNTIVIGVVLRIVVYVMYILAFACTAQHTGIIVPCSDSVFELELRAVCTFVHRSFWYTVFDECSTDCDAKTVC